MNMKDYNYVKSIENALMNVLDKLSKLDKDFDYVDTLREVSGFNEWNALDFLDKFGDGEYTRCIIEWQDNKSQQEVIIKENEKIVKEEDDKVFFYGLSYNKIEEFMYNDTICENEWKIIKIIGREQDI